jgi:hypothetical protein
MLGGITSMAAAAGLGLTLITLHALPEDREAFVYDRRDALRRRCAHRRLQNLLVAPTS